MAYIKNVEGQGKSDRALAAESQGRYPITHAPRVLRDGLAAAGIKKTLKACRQLLEADGTNEWHHTGKYGKRTWYYDTRKLIERYTLGREFSDVSALVKYVYA